ncbi:ParB N-terminal domain-containing protein [Paraeggerthella hongkongensis]|uniref:ParB/RepB/Spo0J family partition protein n=1 Tax=Paraeggerthella hominis TaxID=2897351 RepID=UPI001C10A5CF|nr:MULTISPECIES: ParB N-terminal domain-containing protein [Paraeggerthella]MBU5406486.1 ParB N-terminal domain-containing protein [Paraeggerthella hongkongensis]MCD2434252.1 ParB N-terminal domain-containing protein [Paraeggerthella hominis]
MSNADQIAKGFSISGLLDERAQVRERYPIEEVEVAAVTDSPANIAYSMDADAIARLAASIEREGLTDIPLARRLEDGSLEMISGHRRKAAFALLSKRDEKFAKMPCRIMDGIDDKQAEVLLHTANYHNRQLSVMERAAASAALGEEVERLREDNPELAGVRSEDIKAAIITEQTGKKISGKTIQRQEARARKASALAPQWQAEIERAAVPDKAIDVLAKMDEGKQHRAFEAFEEGRPDAKSTVAFLKNFECSPEVEADLRLVKARAFLDAFAAGNHAPNEADKEAIADIVRLASQLASVR